MKEPTELAVVPASTSGPASTDAPGSTVIEALSNVFAIALRTNALADATEIVDTLALIGPSGIEWDSFYATIQMQSNNYPEAIRLFRNCPMLLEKWSWGRAALACCLFEMKDEEWRMHAQLVLQDSSSEGILARKLASGLFARMGEHVPGMVSDAEPQVQEDVPPVDTNQGMSAAFMRA